MVSTLECPLCSSNYCLKTEVVQKLRRNGLARECIIIYKSIGQTDRILTVERPVREVVKLFNVEDTSLLQEIENSRKISMKALDVVSLSFNNTSQNSPSNLKKSSNVTSILGDYHEQMDAMNKMTSLKQFEVGHFQKLNEGQFQVGDHYWEAVHDYFVRYQAYVQLHDEKTWFHDEKTARAKDPGFNDAGFGTVDEEMPEDDPMILF